MATPHPRAGARIDVTTLAAHHWRNLNTAKVCMESYAASMVDNLATQFSSALDFYRELVQNSIDAGSDRIEVWTEYIDGEAGQGTMVIHVDDFGEGMDEEIIDSQLTQLFSSTKENDLTKIGKFGIGFVSVFAMKPKAVLIQTGRGGEYWEVIFNEDKSFQKAVMETPVEGTQLTLFVAGTYAAYMDLVRDSVVTLRRWCAHSETEITFEDRSSDDAELVIINAPFALEGTCVQRVELHGTEVLVGYSLTPEYGFYNGGLTLTHVHVADDVLGSRARRFVCISVKIKSRYLEHTLSRETVLMDENYEKAMEALDEVVQTRLQPALVGRLRELCAQPTWDRGALNEYALLLQFLALAPMSDLLALQEEPILRTVDEGSTSLADLAIAEKQDGRIYTAGARTELVNALCAQGIPVLVPVARVADGGSWSSEGFGNHGLLSDLVIRFGTARQQIQFWERMNRWVGGIMGGEYKTAHVPDPVCDPHQVYERVSIDDRTPAEFVEFVREIRVALKSATRMKYKEITTGTLPGVANAPFFVVGRVEGPFMARSPVNHSTDKEDGFVAVINREHPDVQSLLRLRKVAPQVAVYNATRNLLLARDRRLETAPELIEHVMKRVR